MPGSAILVAATQGEWITALRAADARGGYDHEWIIDPKPADLARITYACVWRPSQGLLATLPNLKAIVNLGAGVDALLADPTVPRVPIMRAAHPDLTRRVTGYVVMHVLRLHNQQRLYEQQQREALWRSHTHPSADTINVGIMGLGVIGRECAAVLTRMGYPVAGWSRTAKHLPNVEAFHGVAQLTDFLGRTDILVCLLPHTAETDGILNRSLFEALRKDGPLGGPSLINAARGKVQVDDDILAALDDEILQDAVLDVFPQEPLPATSRFWAHPRVIVTPHVAGDIAPDAFADHVLAQIDRCERGLPIQDTIDRDRGY